MARHQATLRVVGGDLEMRCRCGWRRDLGSDVDMAEPYRAFGEHHAALRGPVCWTPHLRFGWDDEAPIPEPPGPDPSA